MGVAWDSYHGSSNSAAAEVYFYPSDSAIQHSLLLVLDGQFTAVGVLLRFWPVAVVGLGFVALCIFLSARIWRLDRVLGVYLAAGAVPIVIFRLFPSLRGFPRFLSFLFPIGLALHMPRRWLIIVAASVFLAFDYIVWWGLLMGIVT
jgi:hypothetical protein